MSGDVTLDTALLQTLRFVHHQSCTARCLVITVIDTAASAPNRNTSPHAPDSLRSHDWLNPRWCHPQTCNVLSQCLMDCQQLDCSISLDTQVDIVVAAPSLPFASDGAAHAAISCLTATWQPKFALQRNVVAIPKGQISKNPTTKQHQMVSAEFAAWKGLHLSVYKRRRGCQGSDAMRMPARLQQVLATNGQLVRLSATNSAPLDDVSSGSAYCMHPQPCKTHSLVHPARIARPV